MTLASVSPEDAISNLAGWAQYIGIDALPTILTDPAVDKWATVAGGMILAASVSALIVRKHHKAKSRNPAQELANRAFLVSNQIKELIGNPFLYGDHADTITSEAISLLIDFDRHGFSTPVLPESTDPVAALKIVARYLDRISPLIRNGQINEAKRVAEAITAKAEPHKRPSP